MSMEIPGGNSELDHEEARAELSAYLDGRLAPERLQLLEQHLGSCRECAQEMAAVRATRQMLQALPELRVPRPFTLEAPAARRSLPALYFWLRAATGLAAACFVIIVALPILAPAAIPRTQVAAPAAGQPPSKPELSADSALRQGREGQPTQPASADAAGSSGEAKKQASLPTAPPAQPRAAAPAAAPAAPAAGGAAPAAAPAVPAPMPTPQPAPAGGAAAAAPQRAAEPALSAEKPGAATASQPPTTGPATPADAPVSAPLAAGEGAPEPLPSVPAAAYSAPAANGAARAGGPESTVRPSAGPSPATEAFAPRDSESDWDPLAALRSLLGGVTILLASATGAIWWRHRYR